MLYYLKSNDPNDYASVKFSGIPIATTEPLMFRIKNFSTITSFIITDETDFIKIKVENNTRTFKFKEKTSYEIETLAEDLNLLLAGFVNVELTEASTLSFTSNKDFEIIDASHRVKLLLGLYFENFPIRSNGHKYVSKSVPYINFGNNLFIRSRISNVVGINTSSTLEYVSICYNIIGLFIPNIPLIFKDPGNYVKINSFDLLNLSFTLVDSFNVPIKLKSPINLTVEVIYEKDLLQI